MRNAILLLLLLEILISGNIFGQVPQFINYQAIARNNKGEPLQNQSITLRASVLAGSTESPSEFVEVHNISTNQFGLFTIAIGNGAALQGAFKDINWSTGPKYLKVEIDFGNKNDFQLLGVTQFLSVPYALYAEKSGTAIKPGDGISINNNTILNTAPDVPVSLTGSGGSIITGTYPNYNVHSPIASNYAAGSGISIAGTTISNANPDVPVNITGSGSAVVTGTYPNYNVHSPSPSNYIAGTGITITGTTISNTAPNVPVSITGSGNAVVTGIYPNYNVHSATPMAGTGIAIVGATISNTAPDVPVSITGSGSSVVTGTYPNYNVHSATPTAGTGIAIAGTAISNTAPDQTVILNGAGGTNITGTYPNFTISSPQLTAGTGISINSSNQIINSAPDQTVSISASGTTTITGTYPNFNINTNGFNFQYPDGFNNIQSVVHALSAPYIVPGGKNLYITFVSQRNFSHITIDGITIGNPGDDKGFIVPAGSTVSSLLSSISFCGYLVDQTVIPLIINLSLSSYQVPAGKTLYILKGSTDSFFINGVAMGNSTLIQPIILGEGQTISSPGGFAFNGFLK